MIGKKKEIKEEKIVEKKEEALVDLLTKGETFIEELRNETPILKFLEAVQGFHKVWPKLKAKIIDLEEQLENVEGTIDNKFYIFNDSFPDNYDQELFVKEFVETMEKAKKGMINIKNVKILTDAGDWGKKKTFDISNIEAKKFEPKESAKSLDKQIEEANDSQDENPDVKKAELKPKEEPVEKKPKEKVIEPVKEENSKEDAKTEPESKIKAPSSLLRFLD